MNELVDRHDVLHGTMLRRMALTTNLTLWLWMGFGRNRFSILLPAQLFNSRATDLGSNMGLMPVQPCFSPLINKLKSRPTAAGNRNIGYIVDNQYCLSPLLPQPVA